MTPRNAPPTGTRSAFVLALGLIATGAGCDRLQQQGPLPTYPDSKLEVMRTVTGATLPHDPHSAASTDIAVPTAASAVAASAPRER